MLHQQPGELGALALFFVIADPLAGALGVPANMFRFLAFVPPMTAVSSVAVMVFESRRKMVRRNLPGVAENGGRLFALHVSGTKLGRRGFYCGVKPLPALISCAAVATQSVAFCLLGPSRHLLCTSS